MKRNSYIGLFVISMCMVVLGFIGIGYANHQGFDCSVCHDSVDTRNLHSIREVITTPNSGPKEVWFVAYTGWRSFADGDSVYDGVCEVCHTTTHYHTNYDNGTAHFDGQDCTLCHPYNNDFFPTMTGELSHQTHFNDPKGPQINYDCAVCHLLDNFILFADGNPFATTTVCDPCHSPGGAFDGVNDPVVGAKLNWDDGIYEPAVPPEPWPSRLKAGKENWCAGCHDDGSSVIHGVSAPNVMGDNSTYGYNVSGHGRDYYVNCTDCHDLTTLHTDGNARTYLASSDNYREGYRLNEDMAIPRHGESGPIAFRLCMNCHEYSDITGPASNFRDDNRGVQLHETHLRIDFANLICWDSDWNENLNNCTQGQCADSAISCTACHNIHGSPTPAMIRHGELISTAGTTDKVPALRFRWYKADGTQTMVLGESRYGGLLCGTPYNVSFNHVCWGCHNQGEVRYYRVAPPPTIGYSPTSFSFTATPGGPNPPRQSLQIWNAGNGTLNWSVSEHATWLSLSPIRGTDSRTVYVSVNITGLSEGTYIENITITAIGAANSPVHIPVILTVSPPPTIGYSPTSYSFTATQGGNNPPDQTLSITNTGGGTLNWSVGADATWLGLSPTSGTNSGTVTVSVNIAGLTAGTYNATVTITAPGATNSPVSIPVSLTINAPPIMITLLSPNGGEIIPSGSTYATRWSAPPEAVKFTLKYSLNDGSTWKLIASNRTGTSYDWHVPIPGNNNRRCLVKVIGFTSVGVKIGEDQSDSAFTIEVLKLTSPDGGETLKSGSIHTITWTTNATKNPVASAKLFLTKDGGSTWTQIKTLIGNPGSYNWKVPSVTVLKTQCKVKVVLRDSGGVTVGSDISDAFFTIQP